MSAYLLLLIVADNFDTLPTACPSHVCLNGIAQYTYSDLRVGGWHILNISDLIILPSRCIIEAKPSFPGVKLC